MAMNPDDIDAEVVEELIASGYVTSDYELTDAGSLRLHQLRIMQYWQNVAWPRRQAKKAMKAHGIASSQTKDICDPDDEC